MKRSLLSSFDPLPHALSTKGLSALVAIVVLGIGVTVARYLESSTGPARRSAAHSVFSRPNEVRAAPSDAVPSDCTPRSSGEFATRRSNACKSKSWSGSCLDKTGTHVDSTTAKPVEPTTPSLYGPEDKVSGS
jgi:hypothetical protein